MYIAGVTGMQTSYFGMWMYAFSSIGKQARVPKPVMLSADTGARFAAGPPESDWKEMPSSPQRGSARLVTGTLTAPTGVLGLMRGHNLSRSDIQNRIFCGLLAVLLPFNYFRGPSWLQWLDISPALFGWRVQSFGWLLSVVGGSMIGNADASMRRATVLAVTHSTTGGSHLIAAHPANAGTGLRITASRSSTPPPK